MFVYTAFNPEWEPLVYMPVDTLSGEVFKSGEVANICLMFNNRYLGRIENFNVHHLSVGDTLTLKMDNGGYSMLAQMGNVLRWRGLHVSDLFNMIYQIGIHLDGQETRKPVHHFRPQARAPKPAVPNEESQRIRWWSPGRLLQRLSWPKWFLK